MQCANKWYIYKTGYANIKMIRNIMATYGREITHKHEEYNNYAKIDFFYNFDDMSIMNNIKNLKGMSIGTYVNPINKLDTYEYSLKDIFTLVKNQFIPYYVSMSQNIKIIENRKSKTIYFMGAGIGVGGGVLFEIYKNTYLKLGSNLKYYFLGQEHLTYNINFGIVYTYDILY